MKNLLIILVLSILPLMAGAEPVEIDGIFYILNEEGHTAIVTSNPNTDGFYSGDVTIPETVIYNGVNYTITSIGESAFEGSNELSSIFIPNTITRIEGMAFFDTALTSVTINSSVKFIGGDAFSECANLEKVIVPDLSAWCSITFENETAISFNNRKHLYSDENTEITALTIPSDVTAISNYAFAGCTSLTSVTIPNSLTAIGDQAFYNCSGLLTVNILAEELSIGDDAFGDCSSVTDVYCYTESSNIEWDGDGFGGVTKIHVVEKTEFKNIFQNASSKFDDMPLVSNGLNFIISDKTAHVVKGTYEGDIEIPASVSLYNKSYDVVAIDKEAFQESNLTSIIIPNTVISIGGWAFEYCQSLTSLTIPNSVKYIGEAAFADCPYTSVRMGNGVISIEKDAFGGCSNLKKVIVPDMSAWCAIDFKDVESNPLKNGCSLYSDENTEITDLTIPSDVTSICNYAFAGCTSLTSVTIPNRLTSVGDQAFFDCRGLLTVNILAEELSIGSSAFVNCFSVKDVYCYTESSNIEWDGDGFGGVTKFHVVEKSAYEEKFNNTNVNFTDVFTISDINYKIVSATEKTVLVDENDEEYSGNIIIPASISLNNVAFSVVAIGSNAFDGCKNLISISIPSSVSTIGSNAFRSCNNLEKVIVPDLSAWCSIIFEDVDANPLPWARHLYGDENTEITALIIPSDVTAISNYAFTGCVGLTSVTIGSGVTSIGEYAFDFPMQKVIIPDISAWCSINFGNEYSNPLYLTKHIYSDENTEITNLVIPSDVTSIGSYAFLSCNYLTTVTIRSEEIAVSENVFDLCSQISDVYCYTEPENMSWTGRFFPNSSNVSFHVMDKSGYETKFPNANVTFVEDMRIVVSDGITYNIISTTDKTAKVVAGIEKYEGNLEIASSISDNNVSYSVVAIDNRAFQDCRELTSITIPSSVTSIGDGAFGGCSGLTSIAIPNSVTSIGEDAFQDCEQLEKVIIPDISAWCSISFGNGYSNPLYHAKHIFSDETTEITDLIIPLDVTSIGSYAFLSCNYLTTVTIRSEEIAVSENVFDFCSQISDVYCYTEPENMSWTGRFFPNSSNVFFHVMDKSGYETKFPNANVTFVEDMRIVVSDGITYNIISTTDKTAKVVAGIEKYEGNLEIVSSISVNNVSYSVVAIDNEAFQDCSELISIIIPSSVTSIGDGAFWGCSGLTSITIPNSVTSIGDYVFYSCSGLTSVIIPNSVTSIGESAFDNCSSLTSITIPNRVTTIGHSVFGGCSGLTSITIPSSVTSIGDGAFYGCSSLTSVTIPTSVTSIGDEAFYGCSGLTSLTIPNNVTSIGVGAFGSCSGISTLSIGSGLTTISESAFHLCIGLTTLTIPVNVTSIGDSSFRGCTGLTTLTIESDQLSVGNYSFFDCSSVTDVYCFMDSENLEWQNQFFSGAQDVEFHVFDKLAYETKFPDARVVFNDYFPHLGVYYKILSPTDKTAQVVAGIEKYEGDMEIASSISVNNVSYSVVAIADEAFYECTNLTTVIIPGSVISIGNNAFANCSGLTSITIGNGVTSIGNNAFDQCTGLASVSLPSSITSLGKCAFYGCTSLNSLTISNGITSISESAFADCSSLTSVTIPNSVLSIEESAFGNSGLSAITIPNSVSSLGNSAFYGCSSMTSITISNSITSINNGTFKYCSGLTSVTIPTSVTSIGDEAFYGCSGLTSLTIPNNVTSIGVGAFGSCSGISTLSIGSGLTTISESAFRNCSSLLSLIIPDNITIIEEQAFRDCSTLTLVSIPSSVTSIGNAAFMYCNALTTVKVNIKQPIAINNDVFSDYWKNATLYVPMGYKRTYAAVDNWKFFKEIKEIIEDGSTISADLLFSGSNLWAGYVAEKDLELPEGMEAYVITSVGTSTATASALDYIPEGVPVLLKRDDINKGIYTVYLGSGAPPTSNLLEAYNTDKEVYYRDGFILYQDEFVLVNNGILPAGRIFLPNNDKGIGFSRSIMIEGGSTTGLGKGQMGIDDSHEIWYDIQGRRLGQKPTKNGLYILNGRIVVVK